MDVPGALTAMDPPAPLAPIRLGPTHRSWKLIDGTSMRPGFHLTPQRVLTAYRQAELGQPMLQSDLFEDVLENDGHMRGQYEARLMKVAFRPWIIQPGGKEPIDIECAQRLMIALRRCNMLACFWHLMDAIGMGWSGVNTMWVVDPFDNAVVPRWFLRGWHRRFIVDEAGMGDLRFRTEENQWPGDVLNPGEWILAERMARLVVRGGLFRTTSWWAVFKRMSITDWIVFAEKFGIPIVMGQYQERASEESRRALLQAVQDVGSDGAAILSELTKIVIESEQMRAGDISSLHPAIAGYCNAEISKVITGATLNVDNAGGSGSYGLGKVHENRADDLIYADAFWLQDVFLRGVILPFKDYNPRFLRAADPRLVVRVRPEMKPDVAQKVYAGLQAMGVEIEGEQMYEEFGLRRPEGGDALSPLYVAPTPQVPAPPPP